MRVLTTAQSQSVHGGIYTLIENYAFDDAFMLGAMIGLSFSVGIGVIARTRYNNPPISLSEVGLCTLKTGFQYCLLGGGLDLIRLTSNYAFKSILG